MTATTTTDKDNGDPAFCATPPTLGRRQDSNQSLHAAASATAGRRIRWAARQTTHLRGDSLIETSTQ